MYPARKASNIGWAGTLAAGQHGAEFLTEVKGFVRGLFRTGVRWLGGAHAASVALLVDGSDAGAALVDSFPCWPVRCFSCLVLDERRRALRTSSGILKRCSTMVRPSAAVMGRPSVSRNA